MKRRWPVFRRWRHFRDRVADEVRSTTATTVDIGPGFQTDGHSAFVQFHWLPVQRVDGLLPPNTKVTVYSNRALVYGAEMMRESPWRPAI